MIQPDDKDNAIITEFLNDKGIVVITIHDNSNCFETLNRECLMIECMGLEKLCNKISGTTYGLEGWNKNKRKNFGLMVLYSTYKRYISERLMPIKMNEILLRRNFFTYHGFCTTVYTFCLHLLYYYLHTDVHNL